MIASQKQFDVIVTETACSGDMLSDVAAMLTGNLGMPASAFRDARSEDRAAARDIKRSTGSAPGHYDEIRQSVACISAARWL